MVRTRWAFGFLWPVVLVSLLNRGPKIGGPWWSFPLYVYPAIGLSLFAGWCFERAQKATRW